LEVTNNFGVADAMIAIPKILYGNSIVVSEGLPHKDLCEWIGKCPNHVHYGRTLPVQYIYYLPRVNTNLQSIRRQELYIDTDNQIRLRNDVKNIPELVDHFTELEINGSFDFNPGDRVFYSFI
jgi:hypothetical protein